MPMAAPILHSPHAAHDQLAEVGAGAPNATLQTIDGETVRLAELWRDQPLLLFFMRHLGCALCRTHVRLLAKHYPQIRAQGAEVAAITFADTASAAFLQRTQSIPFPVLLDLPRTVYRAFGMIEGSLWDVGSPRILLKQARQITNGQIPSIGWGANIRQLGGTVIIDTRGVIQLYHLSIPIDNYPAVEDYLEVLGRLAGVSGS